MEELDLQTIKKRSVNGVFALISRTFVIQLIALLLTIFLEPSLYGVFVVVSAIISPLSYFSDIGLAAALVQKKEAVTKDDLKTTFTIQQVLVISIVAVALLLSNQVSLFYNLEKEGIFLFQAIVIAFFLSSLKTIPSVILERSLNFKKLIIPQIVETLVFNFAVLFFILRGFEVASFAYAVLLRGITGLITIYLIAPWPISVGFNKESAKKLLSFGVPFQLNSILALIKDDLFVVFLGRVLPLAQVGYIGFAQKWAFTPLRLVMDNVIRITFPSFSRLSHDKDNLAKGIEKALFASSFIIFPAVAGIIVLFPYVIELFPKYQKWEPALFSLSFFSINAFFSSISTPLTNALNAIGKIKTTLKLMIFWTVTTWILTPLLIYILGYNGVAIASAIISTSSIGVFFIVKRYIDFDISKIVLPPLISAIIMGIILYFLSPFVVVNLFLLLAMIIFGFILYSGVIFILSKNTIVSDIKFIRESMRS